MHCKNKLAIDNLNGWGIHWFWHQKDDYTITNPRMVMGISQMQDTLLQDMNV